MKKTVGCYYLMVFCALITAQAQPGVWQTNGPKTNARTVNIFVDPDNALTIYLATANNGLYYSTQGGSSWIHVSAPMDQVNVHELIKTQGTIFARSENDLYYTNDGFTWQQSIMLDTVNVYNTKTTGNFIIHFNEQLYAASIWGKGLFTSSDGGATWSAISTSLNDKAITTFQIHGDTLYAGTTESGLYYTSDGQNWIQADVIMAGKNIANILVTDNLILAGGRDGLFQIVDSKVWQPAEPPLDSRAIYTLAYYEGILYAGTESGLYYSENDAETWDSSLVSSKINCMLFVDEIIYAGTNTGIYRSDDRGQNWSSANPPLDAQNIIKFASGGEMVYSIIADGLYRLASGENNWFPTESVEVPAKLHGFIWSQNYILAYGSNIYRSINTGSTWQPAYPPVDWGVPNIVNVIALDYGFIAAADGIFLSQDGIDWTHQESPLDSIAIPTLIHANGNLFAGTTGQGVYHSSDGGYNWEPANLPMNDKVVNVLLNENGKLYAGTKMSGVYFSSDQGINWSAANAPLNDKSVNVLCFSNGKLFAGTDKNGVFVNNDQGQNWTAAGPLTQTEQIENIFFSDGFMICGGAGHNFISRDGGLNWVTADPPLADKQLYDFSVVDTVFYLSTWRSESKRAEIFRSIDSGTNWTPLNTGLTGLSPCMAPQYLPQMDRIYLSADGVYYQTPDFEPPTEPSITRDDTSKYVTSRCTDFVLYAIGADSMMLSEHGDFHGAHWQVYQPLYRFCIQETQGDVTVYAKFKDISGNESDVNSTSFILDTTFPTFSHDFTSRFENLEAIPIAKDTIWRLIVSSNADPKTGFARLVLYYRYAGETFSENQKILAERDSVMNTSIHMWEYFWKWRLSGDMFTEYGIDMRIFAVNRAGNSSTAIVNEKTYFSQPVSLFGKDLGSSSLIPGGTAAAAFRIVSLPMKPAENEFHASLLGRFGEYGTQGDWMFWRYEGNAQWRSSANIAIEDGRGYFLQLRNSTRLSPGGRGTTMKTTAGVLGEISGWQLRPGDWTLIGNPYLTDIQLNQLKLKNRDILLSESSTSFQVWSYDGGGNSNGWTNEDLSLEPWGGLAVFLADSLAGADMIVFANPQKPYAVPEKPGISYTDQMAKLSENEWRVQIKAAGNGFSDKQNFFGVRSDAAIGHDSYDWYEPPLLPGGLALSFPHPEWNISASYTCDIRPVTNEGYIWDINISGAGGTSVSLEFENLHTVPPGFQVLLLDDQTGLVRDLHKQSKLSVRIPKESTAKVLKIIVGTGNYIANRLAPVSLVPDHFSLYPNYPNPFNPTTVIRYGLPVAGRVNLKIFDLLGREVLILERDDLHDAGYYEHVVDMRSYGSGVYFYQIKVSGESAFSAARKMLLVK